MSELDQDFTFSYWRRRADEYRRLAKENPSFEALAAAYSAAANEAEGKTQQSPSYRRMASR
jgi:hypothetical protein